jgi:hypothetical protein
MHTDLEKLVAAMAQWLEAAHTRDRAALDAARRSLSEFTARQQPPDTDRVPQCSAQPPAG